MKLHLKGLPSCPWIAAEQELSREPPCILVKAGIGREKQRLRAHHLVAPGAPGAVEDSDCLIAIACGDRRLDRDLYGTDRCGVLPGDDEHLTRLTGAQDCQRLHQVGRLCICISQPSKICGNGAGLVGQDGCAEPDESEKGTDELIRPSPRCH